MADQVIVRAPSQASSNIKTISREPLSAGLGRGNGGRGQLVPAVPMLGDHCCDSLSPRSSGASRSFSICPDVYPMRSPSTLCPCPSIPWMCSEFHVHSIRLSWSVFLQMSRPPGMLVRTCHPRTWAEAGDCCTFVSPGYIMSRPELHSETISKTVR